MPANSATNADPAQLMQPVDSVAATTPAPETTKGGSAHAAVESRPNSPKSGVCIGSAVKRKASASASSARADDTSTETKTFVLDTNVLLHDPKSLFVFEDNDIVLPFVVLEEIDRFKGSNDAIGRNAREAVRNLDHLRELGKLDQGVSLAEGAADYAGAGLESPTGTLRIDISPHERPRAIDADTPDNRIISVAYALQQAGENVVFVSKDINARIKSDALGIRTEDFENKKVDIQHLYQGYEQVLVERSVIDELYAERMLPLDKLPEQVTAYDEQTNEPLETQPVDIAPNEFVLLVDAVDANHTGLGRRLADTDHIIPVSAPRKPVFGIMARNVQQTMALDLLLDDDVRFCTLIGSAGTGKTLLAVAAGMTKVYTEERYEKLLVARPIMPMGRDIGYLPGDKDEKLSAWMQPIFDNLSYLLSTRGHHMQNAESHTTEQKINRLMSDGRLILEPLTYIRGRSIPHQFMIVDEAQNLTPHEVKTIVSRVGEGTKIVFTGDIEQIDNPYLDESSNGLTYAVDRMRGAGVVGHISLAKSERSELASLATALL